MYVKLTLDILNIEGVLKYKYFICNFNGTVLLTNSLCFWLRQLSLHLLLLMFEVTIAFKLSYSIKVTYIFIFDL